MALGQGRLAAELAAPETLDVFGGYQPSLRLGEHLEACIGDHEALIERDAASAGIDRGELKRQIRLHLPSVGARLLKSGMYREAYEAVRHNAEERAVAIQIHQEAVALAANMKLLSHAEYSCKRDLSLEAEEGPRLPLRFARITPSVGNEYQAHLHYLRAVRGDTYLQYGIFLPDADRPTAYSVVLL